MFYFLCNLKKQLKYMNLLKFILLFTIIYKILGNIKTHQLVECSNKISLKLIYPEYCK